MPTEAGRLAAGEAGRTAGLAAPVGRVPDVILGLLLRRTNFCITVGGITRKDTARHTKHLLLSTNGCHVLSFAFECPRPCSDYSWPEDGGEGRATTAVDTGDSFSVSDLLFRLGQLHLPHVQICPCLINLVVHLRGPLQLLLVHFPNILGVFQLLFSFPT